MGNLDIKKIVFKKKQVNLMENTWTLLDKLQIYDKNAINDILKFLQWKKL